MYSCNTSELCNTDYYDFSFHLLKYIFKFSLDDVDILRRKGRRIYAYQSFMVYKERSLFIFEHVKFLKHSSFIHMTDMSDMTYPNPISIEIHEASTMLANI